MPSKSDDAKQNAAPDLEWLPLDEAVEAFAPQKLKRQANVENKKAWPVPDDTETPSWEKLGAFLNNTIDSYRERSAPLIQMRASLVRKLQSGELESVGVRVPPIRTADIEIIPKHVFDDNPKIGWKGNTVENFGLEFRRVRVRPYHQRLTSQFVMLPSDLRPGRPSKEDEVQQAIEHAIKQGHDLTSLPRKLAFEHIRASGSQLGLNIKVGFSASVLQRVLHRRFGSRS